MLKTKKIKKTKETPKDSEGKKVIEKEVEETKEIEEIEVVKREETERQSDKEPVNQRVNETEADIDKKEIKLLEEPEEKQEKEWKESEESNVEKEPERRILDFMPDEVEETVSWFQKKISTATFITSHFLLLIVGLLFALGLYYLLYNSLPFSKIDQVAKYIPITTQPTSFNFEIKNPDNELWVFSSSINISGKTSSRASIVISNNDKDYALSASPNGEFSKIINLDTGINEITISGFDNEGNTKLEKRTIFYSEEKIQ